MSLIILTGANDAFAEAVVEAVFELPAIVRKVDAITGDDVERIGTQSPAAIIIGPELGDQRAFELAADFDRNFPDISMVVAVEPGPDAWRKAVQAGVRGVVNPDPDEAELRDAIKEALEAAQRRRGQKAAADPGHARIVTVVSPKGGVGKTVLATNIAAGLASQHHGGVALIDLDLKFGDVAYALMLAPQYTMSDAVGALPDLSSTQLKVFLTSHSSGLFTLCAPDEPAEGDGIEGKDTSSVLRLAASLFGHVVVDTGGGLDEHTLAAIEHSTDVVVVSDMDVPSVRNVRKALDTLDLLGMSAHRRLFVLNRADSRVGLNKDDVRAAAGIPIDLEIPSSRHVPLSLNEGRPLILSSPRSPVSRAIRKLVDALSAPPGERLLASHTEAP